LCALSYSADPSTFFNPWKASSFVAISGKSVFCPPDEDGTFDEPASVSSPRCRAIGL
jgi:hypothetical protein